MGDALSDALLVETVLKARDWDLREWEATYTDLPNRLLKVAVKVVTHTLVTDSFENKEDCQLLFAITG